MWLARVIFLLDNKVREESSFRDFNQESGEEGPAWCLKGRVRKEEIKVASIPPSKPSPSHRHVHELLVQGD